MGSVIVISVVIDSLAHLGLDAATSVVFTGSSAGAEGLYPNADRVAELLGPKKNLRVLCMSAFSPTYRFFIFVCSGFWMVFGLSAVPCWQLQKFRHLHRTRSPQKRSSSLESPNESRYVTGNMFEEDSINSRLSLCCSQVSG